jgi:hypothetical protein
VDDPLLTRVQFVSRMLPRTVILEDGADAGAANRSLFEALERVGAELRHSLFRMGGILEAWTGSPLA